jgi:hypothetical protein
MKITCETVRHINVKLAETQQAVFRTQGRARTSKGAYTLLNIRTGAKSYLTITELEELAEEMTRCNEGRLKQESPSKNAEAADATLKSMLP